MSSRHSTDSVLRRAVTVVAPVILTYFFVEFAVARHIGSVSLFADSVDFLEDATVNFLIVAALGWSAHNRARAGMLLAAVMLLPTLRPGHRRDERGCRKVRLARGTRRTRGSGEGRRPGAVVSRSHSAWDWTTLYLPVESAR